MYRLGDRERPIYSCADSAESSRYFGADLARVRVIIYAGRRLADLVGLRFEDIATLAPSSATCNTCAWLRPEAAASCSLEQ